MRIAFVDYVLDPEKPGRSGLSDLVWDLAAELAEQGHESHIIASYRNFFYPDSKVIVHNFPTPPIGYRNLLGQFLILKKACKIARELQADILHAPEYLSTAVFATLGLNTPLVLTVPGNIFQRIKSGHCYEWYYVQVLKWAARVSARKCARVIAVSKEMKYWWQKTGSLPINTPWIPLGANPRYFFPGKNEREVLGINPDRLLLIFAGRFSPEKGLLDLVSAVWKVYDTLEHQGVQIKLIGSGPQFEAINQKILSHGMEQVIHLLTWIDRVSLRIWYSAADAVLSTSRSEGFSRIIPEAMACGTPIIGSRITGTEDHVHNHLNGFLYPPGDVPALSTILETVANEPALLRQMRASTLAYARRHLLLPAIVKRIIEEVYEPILAGVDRVSSERKRDLDDNR